MSTTANIRRMLRRFRFDTTDFTALAALVFNDLRDYMADGLLTIGTLAIDATPAQFKTTTIVAYTIAGVTYAKAITTGIAFTAAHPVTASKFGIVLVQIPISGGTIATKIPGATQTTTQAYDTAALALAALPAVTAGHVALGYIAIAAGVGGFTANTTALTTIATFVDATPKTLPVAFTA